MNPQTDRKVVVQTPHGPVEIIQPGAIRSQQPSKNWRFSEEAFRRYEPYIRAAVDAWPNETKFEIPLGTSPNTFSHRLRDAISAVIQFGYDPDLQSKLAEIRSTLSVAVDSSGSAVWVKQRAPVGAPRRASKATVAERNLRPLFEETKILPRVPTVDEIKSYIILIKSGFLHGPIVFKGQIDPADQQLIESTNDVAFAWDEASGVTSFFV